MTAATATANRHHVVVVGAGFGGLAAARHLRDAPVDVTVLDARNHHTFQPLLYQVATAGLDGDDIAFPIRGIFGRQANARVRLARVRSVDLDARRLHLGRRAPTWPTTSWCSRRAPSPTLRHPRRRRARLPPQVAWPTPWRCAPTCCRFEEADADPPPRRRHARPWWSPAAARPGSRRPAALAELFSKVLRQDFPRLDVARARVVLLEATDRLLGTFTRSRRRGAAHAEKARRRGAARHRRRRVDADRVQLADGTDIPTRTVVWAAGVKANPLAETLGVELTGAGGSWSATDLSVPGHPEVFVIGDLAATATPTAAAPPARPVGDPGRQALAREIAGQRRRRPTRAVPLPRQGHDGHHRPPRGGGRAAGRHPLRRARSDGWRWLGLHLVYLIGFRNRANVLVNWAWNYLTYDRGSRIIPEPSFLGDRAATRQAINVAKNSRSDTSDTSER